MIYIHPRSKQSMNLSSVQTEEDMERFHVGFEVWQDGALIQLDRALGWLTIDEREFLISGLTPDQFNKTFINSL
tara:strand:- start:433 stop:654 length:222 start_codon:yes stop_codon:yes gene_type:complete